MGSNVIYTAIFGKYDKLVEPTFVTKGWQYICYTDQDFKSDVWEIIKLPKAEKPSLENRKYKCLQYNDWDYSIYIDGNFCIIGDLNSVKLNSNLCFYSHNTTKIDARHTIREEFDACIKAKKTTVEKVNDLLQLYKLNNIKIDGDGIPCLPCCGVIFRKKDACLYEAMQNWYHIIENLSGRDQLSIGYILQYHNLKYDLINKDIRNNDVFRMIGHCK